MHVLIVDDEPDIREIYGEVLKLSGHDSVAVSSGDQALDYLERHRPDVILTDLLMANGNGLQVVTEAKRLAIPIIVISGHSDAYLSVLPPDTRVLAKGQIELKILDDVILEACGWHHV